MWARLVVYRILLLIVLPIGLIWALFSRRHRMTLKERLGFRGWKTDRGGGLLLHTVSVGEYLAMKRLISAFSERYPSLPLTVSTTTMTGQDLARKGQGESVYFPIDLAGAVRSFIRQVNPRLVLIAETEIWPNMINELKKRNIPLLLVNARLSDGSFRSYRRLRWFFAPFFSSFDLILAQSEMDAERFRALGAVNVETAGNLKYDFNPPDVSPEVVELFTTFTASRNAWVAGSTMPGEDRIVLDLHTTMKADGRKTALLLAPRHPERVEEIETLCRERGLSSVRRSLMASNPRPDVVILDTIGELGALFQFFTVAFIGGSLVPTGGHNIIEPAYWGVSTVVGLHMENFRAITEAFLSEGALTQVTVADFGKSVLKLLDDRGETGARGKSVIDRNRGALERTLSVIGRYMP